jgi:hypothetical protein
MLKDIDQRKMEGFSVALIPEETGMDRVPETWECFLINTHVTPVTDVLITARGYGQIQGEPRQSSTLRYFYPRIEGEMAVMLEIIPAELVALNNEFWVSFTRDGFMYDKKFLFVEGSLTTELLTPVPVIGRRGVMIS